MRHLPLKVKANAVGKLYNVRGFAARSFDKLRMTCGQASPAERLHLGGEAVNFVD